MNRVAIANAHAWNADAMRRAEGFATRHASEGFAKERAERDAARYRANCDKLEAAMG
jgi:hypothetical protein